MSLFDYIFGGRDAFYSIDAVRTVYKFCCVLGVLLLGYGFIGMFQNLNNLGRLMSQLTVIILCGYMMSAAPKYLENYKNVATELQQNTGFSPKYIYESAERIGEKTLEDYTEGEDENSHWYDWMNLGKMAGDGIMLIVMAIMTAILTILMVIVKTFLMIAQLLRDVIFYFSVCLVPLAFGLIGGGFDRQKGVSLLFTIVSVASWPLAWLLVDALIFLLLKPYDPGIGSSNVVQNAEVLPALTIASGVAGIVIVCFLYGKIIFIALLGYVMSIKVCQMVFGGISSGLMSMVSHAVMMKTAGMAGALKAGVMGGAASSSSVTGKMAAGANAQDKLSFAKNATPTGQKEAIVSRVSQQNHNNKAAGEVFSSPSYGRPEKPVSTGNWRNDQAASQQYQKDIAVWNSGGSEAGESIGVNSGSTSVNSGAAGSSPSMGAGVAPSMGAGAAPSMGAGAAPSMGASAAPSMGASASADSPTPKGRDIQKPIPMGVLSGSESAGAGGQEFSKM